MSESQAPYSLSIDLNVLKHLGIKLYSNVAAALTEVVANAWDADAENVWISISDDNCSVSILDDGHGMNSDDLNKKYLRVGYERREQNEARSPKGRPVMGRKGLGKLALFSIANSITVQSVRDSEKNGFVMTLSGIENAIKSPDGIQLYKPKKINEDELTIDIEHGTLISLDDIKSKKIALTITAMKKILARRFSVIGNSDSFKVYVNNSAIVMADKEDRRVVQLAWVFGNDSSSEAFPSAVEKYVLSDRDESWSPEWKVTGWLGTAAVPKDLNHDDLGNINTIVVMARGRVFQENILDKIPENRIYARYLTGVIQADFLDEDDEDDIATSDRQRIQEDDPRFRALVAFVKKSMQAIEKTWSEKRKQIQGEKAIRANLSY